MKLLLPYFALFIFFACNDPAPPVFSMKSHLADKALAHFSDNLLGDSNQSISVDSLHPILLDTITDKELMALRIEGLRVKYDKLLKDINAERELIHATENLNTIMGSYGLKVDTNQLYHYNNASVLLTSYIDSLHMKKFGESSAAW